jgi:uncharacterized membrane protein
MRRAIAKAITWRLIGTAEIFAISFWTTGHIATAGHTAGIVAISSVVMYVAHELAWSRHEGRTEMMGLSSCRASDRSPARERHVCEAHQGGCGAAHVILPAAALTTSVLGGEAG